MDETWDGDEEEPELPVVGAPAAAKRRPMAKERPKGVPLSAARDVRRELLAKATGKDLPEPEQWREELDQGQRDRAGSSLLAGGRRGSGSGFGLA